MAPTAEELKKQDIIEVLTWDENVNANNIHVRVHDRTVQLMGTVPSYIAKLAAEKDVLQIPGVVHVENHLEIEFPPSTEIHSDKDIVNDVKKKLKQDGRIGNPENIIIESLRGVVLLSGQVSSSWEKYLAGEIAGMNPGVIDIENDILVHLSQAAIDSDIEKDIRNTYERNLIIDENEIDVNVRDAIVYLTGFANNELVKREAVNIALYTEGVTDVIDEIFVRK